MWLKNIDRKVKTLTISMISVILVLSFTAVSVSADVINILSDYATIQEAVYKASPKDTIIVSNCYNGTKEGVEVYKDNLTIIISGDFTIEANDDEDPVLNVTGDHTNISGFNIIGASDIIVVESNASSNIFYGICMYDSNNNIILECVLLDNYYGTYRLK